MAVDISDLPVPPSATDISDLPIPPKAQAPQIETGSFAQNVWGGMKKSVDDLSTGIAQRYSEAFEPNIKQPLQDMAAKQREYYAPLQDTMGGKIGQAADYALPSLLTGGVAGGAAMGAALGGLQPTTQGESPLTNAAVGGVTGGLGNKLGNALGGWAAKRAAEPVAGWTSGAINQTAAQAVGSSAPKLNQAAIADTAQRFKTIFDAARSPAVIVPVQADTKAAVQGVAQNLNSSAQKALLAHPEVTDLLAHVNNFASAAQLGSISSKLGKEAASEMKTQGGDRALGQALYEVKDHVDQLVGRSIQDPGLKAAYNAALPQYRQYLNLTSRPTILNSVTGKVNPEALGKYLQKADKKGYTQGANQSPLYQAARFGQANGNGGGAPPLLAHPIQWAAYSALHNPLSNVSTGLVSRALLPARRALPAASQGLMATQTPGLAGLLGE